MQREQKNIMDIFEWARQESDSHIVDRIFVNVLPHLLDADITITDDESPSLSKVMVSQELYGRIITVAEELTGRKFDA